MKTPKFHPHYNSELGRKYYQARDYYSDMKKAGLAPYDPSSIKKVEAPSYARSEWANEMYKDIRNRKGRKPGDRFISELEKRGFTQKAADKARKLAG